MRNVRFIILTFVVSALVFSCSGPNKKAKEKSTADFSGTLTPEEIAGKKLTPEILWKFGRIGEMQVSPDGKTVLYSVTRYDIKANKGNTDLFLLNLSDGKTLRITSTDESESNPRWHPSGNQIGFLSSESGTSQIWEITPDGKNRRQVSFYSGDINSFEYAPTGDKIYFTAEVKTDTAPSDLYPDLPLSNAKIYDDLMARHWNQWHDYAYSHIFTASYKEGTVTEIRDIMPGEQWDAPLSPYFEPQEIAWSPDGKYIAYTSKKLKGKEYAVSTNSDIYLYSLETGATENLTEGMPGYDRNPVFSPNGKKLLWTSMATPGYEADKDRLFLIDLLTREKTYLTEQFDQSVSSMVWSRDGSKIYFISGIKATFQVYEMDPATRNIRQITSGPHDYTSLALAGDMLVGTRMSIRMAPEIFSIRPSDGIETQLSFVNKNIYDNIAMGEVRERWVKTTDGKDMLVWVIYPPDFDSTKTYPALLYCQGGPQSAVSQFFSFRWNFQIMAANGYIVVAPNRRGLPTFGQEWNDQIAGDYGGQNMKDYLSAIDNVSKEPYVDASRLGCVGASYGGYSVFWLAGHHNKRFKAFIAHCGIFNLESKYASTEELWFPNHDLGGPPWENPKPASYRFSPHLYVENWDTPILIITGGNDFRIPYTESLQAFTAARLRNLPARLLFFPEESHFVLKPQNSILWQREFFGWLDKYVKRHNQ